MATRKAPSDRELINTGTSKRYVQRAKNGRFTAGQVLIGPRKSKAPAPKRKPKP